MERMLWIYLTLEVSLKLKKKKNILNADTIMFKDFTVAF